eukprot:489105-Amphidinium_carterae.1
MCDEICSELVSAAKHRDWGFAAVGLPPTRKHSDTNGHRGISLDLGCALWNFWDSMRVSARSKAFWMTMQGSLDSQCRFQLGRMALGKMVQPQHGHNGHPSHLKSHAHLWSSDVWLLRGLTMDWRIKPFRRNLNSP